MSSGQRRIVENTRERLLSSDVNRLQTLAAATIADVIRDQHDSILLMDSGFVSPPPTTVGTPLYGAVLNGLMVVAPVGGVELAVTPGSAILEDPDGQAGSSVSTAPNPDDSIGKLCIDRAGVLAGSGTLVFTANGAGSVRVDVVEMRRSPSLVDETDNRDIFDSGTGLFTAVAVTKIVRDGIQYRIRLGTAGAGFPGAAAGWMPIAVIATPPGAASFDPCTIYDVRPLVTDRADSAAGARALRTATRSERAMRNFKVDTISAAPAYLLSGSFVGSDAGGYNADTLPPSGFDLRDVANHAPGYVPAANALCYVWQLQPHGLPRWVLYSTVAVPPFGGRVPLGPRGIWVVTGTGPIATQWSTGDLPSIAIPLPPSSGFDAGSSSIGNVMLAAANDGASAGCVSRCARNRVVFGTDTLGGTLPIIAPPITATATESRAVLVPGTHIPTGARAVFMHFSCTFTGVAGTEFYFNPAPSVRSSGAAVPASYFLDEGKLATVAATMPAGGSMDAVFQGWFELPPNMTGAGTIVPTMNWAPTAGVVKGADFAFVVGWEL